MLVALACASVPVSAQSVTDELRQQLDLIREMGSIEIEGTTLSRESGIVEVYERAAFQPLWTHAQMADELDRAIAEIEADGLVPAHYNQRGIARLAATRSTPATVARLDLLRTDAVSRLIHDLRFGRAVSTRPAFTRTSDDDAVRGTLDRIVRTRSVVHEVRALRPQHFVYSGLIAALADLRRMERAGGWNFVPRGRVLALDSVGPAVDALRERLAAEGYATGAGGVHDFFDPVLDAAVRAFQHRHGLNEDGIVGSATLAELNVPVATRIDQVRINLERARWVTHDLPATFLAVNIAGAKAYLIRDGAPVFESRVVVGTTSTTTPVFRAVMTYIDLNPTWTVPAGIVGEVLGVARRDPDYLVRDGIRILDRAGRAVDPSSVDLSRYTGRTFPYGFMQEPGPANPLGRIKFMFPNRYNVYLHDTPARELFERERRTFSHGCIRIQDPVRLAELLLDSDAWRQPDIEAAIREGQTRTLRLDRPLPVLVLYWTAAADLHGELHYYRDVYQRDAALLRELDQR